MPRAGKMQALLAFLVGLGRDEFPKMIESLQRFNSVGEISDDSFDRSGIIFTRSFSYFGS